MPIYDYKCEKHGAFEVVRSMKDDSPQVCLRCRRVAKRVFSPTPAIYKVGGFFHIDSGKRFESQLGPVGKETYRKAKEKVGL